MQRILSLILACVMLFTMVTSYEVPTEAAEAEITHEHTYTALVTDPTGKERGFTTYTCSCGDSYVSDYTDPVALYSYHWEMDNNAMVPVDTEGNTVNSLTTVSGSISKGILTNIRYSLEQEVRLYHDVPWIIEWRCAGNWSGMLLSSSIQSPEHGLTYLFRDPGSKIFAFGEYNGSWNNYGMVLDQDMTVPHVFRLENRIASDGSNGVHLLIDGREIGAMDHYYVSAKDQNKTVSWANGKDIVFTNMGTSTHPMNGMQLEYLRIWENGHNHTFESNVTPPTNTQQGYTTYTCIECGYSYMDHYTDPTCNHMWREWTEQVTPKCDAEGKDQRVCIECGLEQYRDTRITGDKNQILVSNPLPEDYFRGKNFLLIGDSITYGVGTTKTYGAFLAEALGVNVTNKGVSGSGYCSGGKMATNKTLTVENVRNADVITIMLGVNDWAWAVKDGSWNGNPDYYDKSHTYYQLGDFYSTDTSTFYGALHAWCRTIMDMKMITGFEDKDFVVITPLITSWNNSVGQRDWDQDKVNIHGHTFREYCTAIMEVCAYYRIPVFDANLFSGIYYKSAENNNVAETGGDGVHVNVNGHALLAEALEEFLREGYSYETREIAHGGHTYEGGVCRDCRLPYICNHVYNSVVTPPTCTEEGFTIYTCSNCGNSYEEFDVPAKGHRPLYAPKDGENHTVACVNCDYSEEAPHSYTNGLCICGQVEEREPIEETTWKMGHSLNLASDISVNLTIKKDHLTGFDMDTVYVLVQKDTYEGDTKTGVMTMELLPVEHGDYYYFTLDGLTAVHMNDTIRSVLYGTKDGQPFHSPVDEYSIATYAYSQMSNSGRPQNLKTLCADLIRYGTKAQIFKAYRLDALADSKMTEEQKNFLSNMESVEFGNTDTVLNDLENAPIKWEGKSLDLASKVTVKFIFSMGTYKGNLADLSLRVSYEDIYGTAKTLTLTNGEVYHSVYGYYAFTMDALLAAELRSVLSVQIFEGEDPVSSTLQYSVDSYGSNKNGTLLDLCKALLTYSDSAKAYFSVC